MKKNNSNKFGFSLVEILISIAVAAVILPAIIILLSFSSFISGQGETYTQAYALAQQEMEMIFNIKNNWDWNDTALSYIPPVTVGFTKDVYIDSVERCGNQICPIGSPGMIDKYTRKVTVLISWNERGNNQEVRLISYVTKI